MEEFGFFAKDVLLKVTNEVYKSDKFLKIPCSAGFKQRDKSYVNEWFDVMVFEDNFLKAAGIEKGDKIKVSGRLSLSEWTSKSGEKKKSWQILASDIVTDKPQGVPAQSAPIEDVPF